MVNSNLVVAFVREYMFIYEYKWVVQTKSHVKQALSILNIYNAKGVNPFFPFPVPRHIRDER